MKLSEHFDLSEFTASDTAARLGIDNTPSDIPLYFLHKLAQTMEEVRSLLGKPIHITSGYRCPALNAAVGSKPSSSHVQGMACDFRCPEFGTILDVIHAIQKSNIDFDQLILEFFDGGANGWVHIGIAPAMRKQLLTINHNGTQAGIVA